MATYREKKRKERERLQKLERQRLRAERAAERASTVRVPRAYNRKSDLSGLVRLYPYQKRWLEDQSRFRIVNKGRQIGYSFIITLEGSLVARATRRNQIYLSRSERQSKVLAEKAILVSKALDIAASPIGETEIRDTESGAKYLQLQIDYPNGTHAYFLPSKPETARSYSGDVYLDEFAFHQDAAKVYSALYPTITRGYRISVVSTPNGQIGKYYEFAKAAGMVDGYERDPYSPWSAHKTNVYQAISEGLGEDMLPDPSIRIHPEIEEEMRDGFLHNNITPTPRQLRYACELRSGAEDRETWLQEFECKFLSDTRNYIPMELILRAEEGDLATEALPDYPLGGNLYMGIDIGRKKHRTVFWVLEQVADILITRAVIVLPKALFQDQYRLAADYMERLHIRKCCVDATGMGGQIAEQLVKDFTEARVEPVQFFMQSKDEMASLGKRIFEENRIRIPSSPVIRGDINGIKASVTRAGNVIFGAEETKEGHSDRAWALFLAMRAAQQAVFQPLSQDNFVGLDRSSIKSAPHVFVHGESRDLTSLLGSPNRKGSLIRVG